jgi:glycosyltransferase involved in cell wall biosynthesis
MMSFAANVARPQLVVVGPLPPPIHGVAVSTGLILSSPTIVAEFDVRHLDTSDRRSSDTIARWDIQNVALGLAQAVRLFAMLFGRRRGVVYLPLSQSSGGFMRDSLFIWAAKLARWNVATHLRGSEFRSHFYDQSDMLLRWWIRVTLRRVTSVAVLGESLRDVFASLVPADRVTVVPNGTPAIAGLNGHRDRSRVVFFSNLRRRKGLVQAVEAALIVVGRCPDAHFEFVGDTDDPELLREVRARAEASGDRIVFRPAIDDDEAKARLLGSAGILLFPPSEPEGHPRVILEAMSAGMAIVTTAQGAIPETVRDGVDGFVLARSDPQLLSASVSRLLDDRDLQARMGDSARERYASTYTLEAADRRLADWLRHAAAIEAG